MIVAIIRKRSRAKRSATKPLRSGGKRRMGSLYEEIDKAPAAPSTPAAVSTASAAPAVVVEPEPLTRQCSARKVCLADTVEQARFGKRKPWHIEFDLSGCTAWITSLATFGVSPATTSISVDQIIAMLGASHTTDVRGRTLREVFLDDVSLARRRCVRADLSLSPAARSAKARALAQGEIPTAMQLRLT